MKRIEDLDELKVDDIILCKGFYDEQQGLEREDDVIMCEVRQFGGIPKCWEHQIKDMEKYNSDKFLWVKIIAGHGTNEPFLFTLRNKEGDDIYTYWEEILVVESEDEKKKCLFDLFE